MAASNVDILPRAVEFVLDNWTVLQLALQHGFGGVDSGDKVLWLKDIIVQVLVDNDKIEQEDLEDYISEVLYNEFDTVVEDGSLEKISQKLCQFQISWKAGNAESIQKEIQSISPVKLTQPTNIQDEDEEEDMDESSHDCTCQAASASVTPCQHCNSIQQGMDSLTINSSSQETTQSNKTEAQNDEAEEGWEVVRRSKRR